MTTYLRYTSQLGVTISVPLVGTFGAGVAFNSTQTGVYMNISAERGLVATLNAINAASNRIGIPQPFSDANIEALRVCLETPSI